MPCRKGATDPSEKNKISAVLAKKLPFWGLTDQPFRGMMTLWLDITN